MMMKHLGFKLDQAPWLSLNLTANLRSRVSLTLIKLLTLSKLTLAPRLEVMCCFSVADVFLEDPPPEKKEEKKEKEEEKVKKNYVLVSDQLNVQPIVSRHHFPAI